MLIYIPEVGQFMHIEPGTGDNLSKEDIESGYVDYLNIETYIWDGLGFTEYDGAQLLTSAPVEEVYGKDAHRMIEDSMDIVFDNVYEFMVIRDFSNPPSPKYATREIYTGPYEYPRKSLTDVELKKYRKKPIVIEAYQTKHTVIINTLEGDMRADVGDYIITGVNGEQYPCKPDIFEKTYEPVE